MDDIHTLFVEIKGLGNGLARVDEATVQNDEIDDDPITNPITDPIDDPIIDPIDDPTVDAPINEPIVDDLIITLINGPDPPLTIDAEHRLI